MPQIHRFLTRLQSKFWRTLSLYPISEVLACMINLRHIVHEIRMNLSVSVRAHFYWRKVAVLSKFPIGPVHDLYCSG
jgi:hypothetical protein